MTSKNAPAAGDAATGSVATKKASAAAGGTQAIHRALQLLDFVCRSPQPVTLPEAAAAVSLPRPTTFRILQALTQHGLLAQRDESRSYTAGLQLFELYHVATHELDLLREAQPELAALSAAFDETVHMAILDGPDIIYVAKEESQRAVRMFSAIGKRAPAYCTGVGKVLLAFASETELQSAVNATIFMQHTPTTVTSEANLKAELTEIRKLGYAIDNGEHELEIRCVASPVFNSNGQLIAGISLTMPASRFEQHSIPALATKVGHHAQQISNLLGYYEPHPWSVGDQSRPPTQVESGTRPRVGEES